MARKTIKELEEQLENLKIEYNSIIFDIKEAENRADRLYEENKVLKRDFSEVRDHRDKIKSDLLSLYSLILKMVNPPISDRERDLQNQMLFQPDKSMLASDKEKFEEIIFNLGIIKERLNKK